MFETIHQVQFGSVDVVIFLSPSASASFRLRTVGSNIGRIEAVAADLPPNYSVRFGVVAFHVR